MQACLASLLAKVNAKPSAGAALVRRLQSNVAHQATAPMSADECRAADALMVSLFEALMPCVVVIENSQCLTTTEWHFMQQVIDGLSGRPGFCLILECTPLHLPTYAPTTQPVPIQYEWIRSHRHTVWLAVAGLTPNAIAMLLKRHWQCDSVHTDVLTMAIQYCGGNPAVCLRLADTLRSSGMVVRDEVLDAIRFHPCASFCHVFSGILTRDEGVSLQ